MAAFERRLETVKALIEAGADVNAKNEEGKTPLHRAVFWENLETVEALLKAGAKVKARDEGGWTPLDLTNNDAIKALLRKVGA